VRRALDELLHRERIDAVISRATEGAYLPQFLRSAGVTFAMFGGVPSYATWVRRHKPWSPKRLTDRWFFLDPLRAADIVLADSCFTRRELTEIVGCDPRRVEVTYLGVEEQFLMLPREPADVVNRFFYCGSLAPYKGASDAIAALGRLAQQGRRDWTLRIAGWGDWETVKRGAREAGIASQVEMLGFLDREQQLKHLAWAHVAVLPSHSESFGLAVAEAQAAGLPVVAYAAGAIPEVVQDGVTAVLAPTGDTARLAEALSRLMDEPHTARRMGAAARDRVASTFTWTRTAQLVRRAIESRRVPRLAPAGQRVADTPPRG
jgi:D-inositol-3-phosphate glycosyltransferase